MTDGRDLLLCALRRGARDERPRLDGVPDGAWATLLTVTPRDLHPYLAYRLPQFIERERIPATVLEKCEIARRGSAVGHLQRQALLRRLTEALDRAGVPIVVLKGMVLAHLAYPDPSLRPMGDIDLWTRPEDLDTAASVILGVGMRYPERYAARTAAAYKVEEAPTRVFELPGTDLFLEVHSVVQSMTVVAPGWADQAWERCVTARLGGVEVRVLHAEDMLAHLAVHCSEHHRFTMGLRPLLDIALWIEAAGPRLDWPRMAERWNREGGDTWIRLTLALTRELLGAPIPTQFSGDAVRPEGFASLYALAREQVLEAHRTLPPTLAKVSADPSLAGRARWLAYRLTAWYWQGPPGASRSVLQATVEAFRRMAADLRHKLPPYVHGLMSGSLRGEEFRKRKALAIGRDRLAELVALEQQPRRGG
jgi:hypothetical protein